MNLMTRPSRRLLALSVAGSFLAGCGGNAGPPRADIAGAVNFKGQPVPAGQIVFEPDASKGNSGPSAYADIKDGRYSTADTGKGTVGGPHVARISGFDGKSADDQASMGSRLFGDYTQAVELPKGEAEIRQDFDVPASAGENLPKGPPVEA